MTEQLKLPGGELKDWLSVLKPYQRETLEQFLKTMGEEAAAEKWLGSTGADQMAPYGGTGDTKPYFKLFKAELDRFLCDESAYERAERRLRS